MTLSTLGSSNPHHRQFFDLPTYVAILVDAAGILLDPDETPRRREQARRRFDKLFSECAQRWPSLFTDAIEERI